MPNQIQNLLSALQQARSEIQNTGRGVVRGVGQGTQNLVGGVKALVSPETRSDYLTGAKQTIASLLANPRINKKNLSNVPREIEPTFQKATEGFTPAAMRRARSIGIKYTPIQGNDSRLPFGAGKTLGMIPKGSAGVYKSWEDGGRGTVTIGLDYAKDPEVLRHELIHAMDTNTNFVGKSKLPQRGFMGVPYTEKDHENSAIANESFNDALPLIKYLSGLGILDSRGFYPGVNRRDREYIDQRTAGPLYRYDNEPADPQMLDLEGMAYMGTTGNEYSLPQYQSAIQEAIRAAQAPSNSKWGQSLLNAGIGKLKPQNHIPGMD